jgi:chorismate synthase
VSANSFGERFRVLTFGESHGVALGAVIEGCPAGLPFDFEFLKQELERRRPGASATVSQRQEPDLPEILSGVFEGKTLGTPIAILVRNLDARSKDYEQIQSTPRAGHADDVWKLKFAHSDHRGGGRSSGRETVARVMAGAVAKMLLKNLFPNLQIKGYASRIGDFSLIVENQNNQEVTEALKKAQLAGESWGGEAHLVVTGVPAGLGQPVFHKLKSDLTAALMSVGATSAVEIGAGFKAQNEKGTVFHSSQQNPYGGIRGGISTGDSLDLRVTFKPTSSLLDVAKKGRHDPCIVPRAVPVLESMVALVLADHALWARTDRLQF